MLFVKISQNFIKPHLKICLISQISVPSLWYVCSRLYFLCKDFTFLFKIKTCTCVSNVRITWKTRSIFKKVIVQANRALLSLNKDSRTVKGSKMSLRWTIMTQERLKCPKNWDQNG